MIQRVTATFKNGTLIPDEELRLPENARVELTVESEPEQLSSDQEHRQAILEEVVEMMKSNPIPESAPRFTRDELHERR